MTNEILAEYLKKDDVFIMRGAAYLGKRFWKVVATPELNDEKIVFNARRMRNGEQPDTFPDEQMGIDRKIKVELILE